ncbi:MAG: PqqD family peptide modification chaperone, partial [Pseudomonadota bacterium]
MTPEAIPTLPRGVRTHYDRVRETDALRRSERVLMLDEIGKAVLDQVDGGASITAISGDLARTYGAPLDQVQADVIEDP